MPSVPPPPLTLAIVKTYPELPLIVSVEPLSFPAVAVPVPAPRRPPEFSVTAPTVPVPVSVPPLPTVVALEAILPVTESVPRLMVVAPV